VAREQAAQKMNLKQSLLAGHQTQPVCNGFLVRDAFALFCVAKMPKVRKSGINGTI
jgi:hypothetical protein